MLDIMQMYVRIHENGSLIDLKISYKSLKTKAFADLKS